MTDMLTDLFPELTVHPRESWQSPSQPVTGPAYRAADVDTLPFHYTAADDLIDGDPGEHAEDIPAYLRAIQRDYLGRGYSIGYNWGVDWLGGIWELRGFDFRCAANRGWNPRTCAVLCLVDGADPLTLEAVRSIRKLHAAAAILSDADRGLHVAPHSEIGATQCCGDGIRAQIAANMFTPWPVATHDFGNDTMILLPSDALPRLLDTRPGKHAQQKPGEPVPAAMWVTVQKHRQVPDGARAIEATITAVEPAEKCWLAVMAEGDGQPRSSCLNVPAGGEIANTTTIPVAADGSFRLFTSKRCDVVVDVVGYHL